MGKYLILTLGIVSEWLAHSFLTEYFQKMENCGT